MTDLRWTTEVPTEPGWYWREVDGGTFHDWETHRIRVVQYISAEAEWPAEAVKEGDRFAGPIPEPKEGEE